MPKEISTKIKLEGEREFNRQMTAINSGLKTSRSDMALLSEEFRDNANSMDALTAKQKLLQSSVEQHKSKVEALNARYSEAKDKLGETDGLTQKYKQQLNQATAALLKEEAALKNNAAALEELKSKSETYVPVTQKLAAAVKKPGQALDQLKKDIKEAASELPVFAELMDVAALSAKGLSAAGKVAGTTMKGVGTVAGGVAKGVGSVAKGVGAITAASAAGVAAIGAGGVVALTTMANMAREAAEAAKAAQEAGETLTDSQKQWLEYSNQLDALDTSVANAKGALAGVLLPLLGDLSTEGAAYLNDFTRDMTAAAGDTGKQTQVLSDYIVKGAKLIKEKLPEYIASGKELFSGLAEGLGENGDELMDMGLDLVYDLLDAIIDHAPELAQAGTALIQKLTESLTERGPDVLASAVGMVAQIVSGLGQAAPSLIPAAVQLVMQLITALISNAPLLLEAGLELIYGIISGILNGLGDIGNSADDIIDAFVERLLSNESKILQFGGKVVDWIRNGISDGWNNLVTWFNNLWDGLFSDRSFNVNVNGDGSPIPGAASGLDYVPYDNYLVRLHKGEKVLTAAEAAAYRSGKSGQTNKIFKLTINTKSLSKEELDMIVEYMNRKLGDDL